MLLWLLVDNGNNVLIFHAYHRRWSQAYRFLLTDFQKSEDKYLNNKDWSAKLDKNRLLMNCKKSGFWS